MGVGALNLRTVGASCCELVLGHLHVVGTSPFKNSCKKTAADNDFRGACLKSGFVTEKMKGQAGSGFAEALFGLFLVFLFVVPLFYIPLILLILWLTRSNENKPEKASRAVISPTEDTSLNYKIIFESTKKPGSALLFIMLIASFVVHLDGAVGILFLIVAILNPFIALYVGYSAFKKRNAGTINGAIAGLIISATSVVLFTFLLLIDYKRFLFAMLNIPYLPVVLQAIRASFASFLLITCIHGLIFGAFGVRLAKSHQPKKDGQ